MSFGVPGHAPEMNVPPLLAQEEVEIQTPGEPPEPVQGPLTSARLRKTLAVVTAKRQPSMGSRKAWGAISFSKLYQSGGREYGSHTNSSALTVTSPFLNSRGYIYYLVLLRAGLQARSFGVQL
jgi:hypothetical protein